MKEVGFLEVVIDLEGIKIEKVKVKRVLDWPILSVSRISKSF